MFRWISDGNIGFQDNHTVAKFPKKCVQSVQLIFWMPSMLLPQDLSRDTREKERESAVACQPLPALAGFTASSQNPFRCRKKDCMFYDRSIPPTQLQFIFLVP